MENESAGLQLGERVDGEDVKSCQSIMKDSQSPFPVDFYSLVYAYYKEHQSWCVCCLGVN